MSDADIFLSSGRVLVGDCLVRLADLDDSSVDSIVTDPPYELGFMGKRWDASGIAYQVGLWQECLRVLKPGGHLLAFGGTRTYHRMACAIEDAGFEIRDSIHWVYGSGFPKSLDVSKAIDKAAGVEREVVGPGHYSGRGRRTDNAVYGTSTPSDGEVVTAPATDEARRWEGWGTALKPAHEPVVVARKPLAGTVAGNVLAFGTGGLNIDGCRVGTDGGARRGPDDIGDDAGTNDVYGKGLGLANAAPRVGGLGRWPANVVFDSAAGEALDAQSGDRPTGAGTPYRRSSKPMFPVGEDMTYEKPQDSGGASRFFTRADFGEDDWPFFYCAKPGRKERNAGLDGLPEQEAAGSYEFRRDGSLDGKETAPKANVHPTVKPVALMRHLVRLVTPPDGTVLDPFLGSGTTAVAATLEGFSWIGCEMTEDYLPIIRGRVTWAESEVKAGRADRPQYKKPAAKKPGQPTLEDQT